MAVRFIKVADPSYFQRCLLIRRAVFIEEMHIDPDLEIDEYDVLNSLISDHFLIEFDGMSVGNIRAVKEGDEVHLGRFCILKEYRGIGLGTMTLKMFEYYYYNQGYKHMTLHAIRSAVPLYERCGYTITSDEFMEAGYPHFMMEKYLH